MPTTGSRHECRPCILLVVAVLAGGCRSEGSHPTPVSLVGAGATFPYPLYARWGDDWHRATGTKLNYQSIGSGGGIQQIKAGTVDFGASDAPLDAKELEASGLVQFPAIMGGVVPVLHLESVRPGSLVRMDLRSPTSIWESSRSGTTRGSAP